MARKSKFTWNIKQNVEAPRRAQVIHGPSRTILRNEEPLTSARGTTLVNTIRVAVKNRPEEDQSEDAASSRGVVPTPDKKARVSSGPHWQKNRFRLDANGVNSS